MAILTPFQKNKISLNNTKIDNAIAAIDTVRASNLSSLKSFNSFTVIKDRGGLSSIIARQVGNLRGDMIAKIQSNILDIQNKFSNGCPTTSEMEKVVKAKNNLTTHLNNFDSKISKYSSVASKLDAAIKTAKTAIKVIKSIPTPVSFPQTIGIPINVLTRYSDALIQLNKTLDRLQNEKDAIRDIVGSVNGLSSNLKTKLQDIDLLVERCHLQSLRDKIDIPDIDPLIEAIQPNQSLFSDIEYRGYTLSIVQDPNSPNIAPKRYAIAKDSAGIIVLYGQSSFSSDTTILIDELKFRIDNKLA